MKMGPIAIVAGLLLIGEGLAFYFGLAGKQSVTALIPAFVGLPILICGALAGIEKLRMHVMHVAVLVGLLGFGAAVWRIVKGVSEGTFAISTQPGETAGLALSVMAVICGVFVGLCVKSFIDARRARKAEEAKAGTAAGA